ncbi:MAG: cell division protein FtsZ [Mycoplasmatales bacterium]
MARYNIKVLGIGGGGSNTVDFLMSNNIPNIQTFAMNTDDQALKQSMADIKIRLGKETTKGLGAGALPEVGRRAAEETREDIEEQLKGAHIVFIAAGMGGGTGTGAAPFISGIAKELGILTIGVVTKPFNFEGPSRMKMALEGLKELENNTDITIVIPNEKLIINHKEKYMEDAFVLPDEVLQTAIVSIVDVLYSTSSVSANIDLNDLRTSLMGKGLAVMGIGASNDEELTGLENSQAALKNAIGSEILEISIHGARNFIIMLGSNPATFTFGEMEDLETTLEEELGYKINCVTTLKEEKKFSTFERTVTIIATDYENKEFVEQITEVKKSEPIGENFFSGL